MRGRAASMVRLTSKCQAPMLKRVLKAFSPGGVKKGPMTGTATLTDAQITDLLAGKYYVNVHTEQNKGGEIRGQLYP